MSVLAKIEPKALAVVEPVIQGELVFSDEKVELIKKNICATATQPEFDLFLSVCQRLRLDPLAKQIYWMKDKAGRVSTITAADGFRLIAQRTGEYEGQTAPQWCGPDGVWRDVWLGTGQPFAARVGVHRKGFREPLYAVARFSSYSKGTGQWPAMGDVMIAKCAEVLALRRAFPNELSGVYAIEEMEQAGFSTKEHDTAPAALSAVLATPDAERKERSEAQQTKLNLDTALANDWIKMIDKFADANEFERWCHYHGFVLRGIHTNAKSRVWTALRHAAERMGIAESLIGPMVTAAPPQYDECDDDGVVNGEVMEGEAAQ